MMTNGNLRPGLNVGVPAGAVLTPVIGDVRVTTPGTVVRDLDITGQLIIEADDVLVRRVRVRDAARRRIVATGRRGVVVEDFEIDGLGGGGEWAVGDSDLTIRRGWIHHVPDGIRLMHRMLVEECLVGDLVKRGEQHLDALQATSCTDATVRRSVLLGIRADGVLGNAAAQIGADTGDIRNLAFEDTFFDGGNDTVSVKTPGRFSLSEVSFARCTWGTQRRYRALQLPKGETLTSVVDCDVKITRWK